MDDEEDVRLEARTDSTKVVTTMLSCLLLKPSQQVSNGPMAWCEVCSSGLSFTVNEAKSLQASAYIKSELFSTWNLASEHSGSNPQESLGFGINLGTLVECLRILSGGGGPLDKAATLELRYRADLSCLMLTLVEGSAVTECKLHTLSMDPVDFVRMDDETPVRIVLKSDVLREGLSELEWGGDAGSQKDKRVTVRVGLQPAQLSLTVSSVDLGCEMVFPPESLVQFEATSEVEFDYRFALVHMALRSIRDSEETMLIIGQQGLLKFMLKFRSDATNCSTMFLDVHLYPLIDDEQDEMFTATGTTGRDATAAG